MWPCASLICMYIIQLLCVFLLKWIGQESCLLHGLTGHEMVISEMMVGHLMVEWEQQLLLLTTSGATISPVIQTFIWRIRVHPVTSLGTLCWIDPSMTMSGLMSYHLQRGGRSRNSLRKGPPGPINNHSFMKMLLKIMLVFGNTYLLYMPMLTVVSLQSTTIGRLQQLEPGLMMPVLILQLPSSGTAQSMRMMKSFLCQGTR